MAQKPVVLCMLDGMGIEDSKSYNIYSSDVMPNLDQFTSRYLFSPLLSSGKSVGLSEQASATKDIGYLNIGACSTVKQSIEIVNSKLEENMFFNNESFLSVINHVKSNNSSIHLITLIGDRYGEDSLVHLRRCVEYCNSQGISKIHLHLYLGANNNSLNKTFPKYTANVHRILNLYPNCDVSIVAGIKHLKDSSGITVTKELYKVCCGGIGEHWVNYNDAVDSNYKRNNLEENIVPFIVSNDGLIGNTDGVFIFNYENDLGGVFCDLLVQPSKYMYTNNNGINIKVCSLFPLQNQTSVSCFTYESVKNSFYGVLNNNNKKHLLISVKENIPFINYYFNGCNSLQATQVIGIDFVSTGNLDLDLSNLYQAITGKLVEAINSNFYDLIVVNYSLASGSNINTVNIKNSMNNIDKCLIQIYNSVIGKNGTLFISSGYGLNEVLYNHKEELVSVDFSRKLPLIIVDNSLSKSDYQLLSGSLCDLGVTVLDLMNINTDSSMTGRNLLITNKVSKKKGGNKTVLIILIFLFILGLLVFGLYYLGYI